METKQSNLVRLMGSQSAHGATHKAAFPKPFSPHLIAPLDPTPYVLQVQVTEEQVKWDIRKHLETTPECGTFSKTVELNASKSRGMGNKAGHFRD